MSGTAYRNHHPAVIGSADISSNLPDGPRSYPPVDVDAHGSRQLIRLPRRIIAVILAAVVAIMLTGCSVGIGVTAGGKLQGARTEGDDSYVGAYTADYHRFDKSETPFGGTGAKGAIRIHGTVETGHGRLAINVANGSNQHITVPVNAGVFDATYQLDGTSFYITLTGDQFTGHLDLTSEEH